MTILVTGANGTVSSALLSALPTNGIEVRALVRDETKAPELPGVKTVIGDLDHPESLEPAFAGVETVWLLTAMGVQAPHQSMNAVWAARQAGVEHIVRMSAIGAAHDAPTRNGRLHALSDAELIASGMNWTIVRPAFFMQNMLGSVTDDVIYGATGEARLAMIDVRDVADAAARILIRPDHHAGKIYTFTGPASVTLRQVADEVSEVLGRRVTYRPVSPAQARSAMIEAGMAEWNAAVNAEYLTAYASGWGDITTRDFPGVARRPARTFAEFARDHTGAFHGS